MKKRMIRQLFGFFLLGLALTHETMVFAQCTVAITADPPCVCPSGTTTLTANVTGGSPSSYLWSNGGTTNPLTGVPAGTYTVTISGGGCPAPVTSAPKMVASYPVPSANFTIAPDPTPILCSNTEFTFIPPIVPAGEPVPTYSWTFTDPMTNSPLAPPSTQASPKRTFTKIGYGTFQVKITLDVTRCFCTNSTSQTITLKEVPNADLIASPPNWTHCNSTTPLNLCVLPVEGDPAKNKYYKIDWGNGFTTPPTGMKSFPYPPIPGECNNYTLNDKWTLIHTVESTTNQCINSKSYSVFKGSNPSNPFTCPPNISDQCTPYEIIIPHNSSSTNTPGTEYEITYYDNDPNTPSLEVKLFEDIPLDGLHIPYETSSCGYTVPAGAYVGSQKIFAIHCKVTNQCVSLAGAAPGFSDCNTGKYGGKPDPDFTMIKNSTGVEVTTACLSDIINLQSITPPTNSYSSICDNNSNLNYQWVITPIVPNTGTYTKLIGSETDPFLQVKFSSTGSYTIELKVSNACPGGPASITKTFCVADLTPTVEFTIPNDPTNPEKCSEYEFSPTITSSSPPDQCGVQNYHWSISSYNGGSCSTGSGTPVWVTGGPNSPTPTIKLVDPGEYTLRLDLENSCSPPSGYHEESFTVKGKPSITITATGVPPTTNPPPYCAGHSYQFTMNVQDCFGTIIPGSLKWYLDPSGSSCPPSTTEIGSGLSVTLGSLPPGPHTIMATAENECGVGCAQISIEVNAIPDVTASPGTETLCSGDSTNISLSSLVSGTSFSWSCTPVGVTGCSSGGGSPIRQQLFTSGFSTGTVTYHITPSKNGCNGVPLDVIVYVKPAPEISTNPPASDFPISLCSGDVASIILNPSFPIPCGNISWTASGPTFISGFSDGSGCSISQILVNTGCTPGQVTYTIHGEFDGCLGPTITRVITVNPVPSLTTSPLTSCLCSGATTSISLSPNCVYGTTFDWAYSSVNVIGGSNGNGNSINQTLTHTKPSAETAVYSITPKANGCFGLSKDYTVTVNPVPIPTINPCVSPVFSGDEITYITGSGGNNYSWSYPGATWLNGGNSTDNFVKVKWGSGISGSVSVNYGLQFGTCPPCTGVSPAVCNVAINPCPANQTITLYKAGTTTPQNWFCEGDLGIDVQVDDCEPGILYELIASSGGGSVFSSHTCLPPGGAFIFPNPVNTTGNYYVRAINLASNCTIPISTSFHIDKIPAPTRWLITPSGPECEEPLIGIQLGLSIPFTPWPSGVNYYWDRTNVIGGPFPAATPPVLTTAFEPDEYWAVFEDQVSGCKSTSWNTVWIDPLPNDFPITPPGGPVCGCKDITLPGSQTGFRYELHRNGGYVTHWIGDGGPHVFPDNCAAGTYKVYAIDIVNPHGKNCPRYMSNFLKIMKKPSPISLLPPSVGYCQGDVTLIVSSPEPDVWYELQRDGFPLTPRKNSPSGANISWFLDNTYSEGRYTVVGYRIDPVTLDQCSNQMSGYIDLCKIPDVLNIDPSTPTCTSTATSITVQLSDPTVTYTLMNVVNGNPIQTAQGNLGNLVFISTSVLPPWTPAPTFAPGTYYITASHTYGGKTCSIDFGNVVIDPAPQIDLGPDLQICAGVTTSVTITAVSATNYITNNSNITWQVTAGAYISLTPITGSIPPSAILVTGSSGGTRTVKCTVEGILSCIGLPISDEINVDVQTLPELTSDLTPDSICSGSTFSYTPTSTVNPGTTFSWTMIPPPDITAGTLNVGGDGSISQVLTNSTAAPIPVTYVCSLSAAGCPGPTEYNVVVVVNPTPVIPDRSLTRCSKIPFSVSPGNSLPDTIVPANTCYTWMAPVNPNVTGMTPGTCQPTISQTLTNLTNVPQTVVYVITPTGGPLVGGCPGSTFNLTVTVNPTPVIPDRSLTRCSKIPFSVSPGNSLPDTIVPANTCYTWMAPVNPNVTGMTPGTCQPTISQTLTNLTNVPQTVVYVITPMGGPLVGGCPGSTFNLTVTVNPTPVIPNQTTSVCSGELFSFNPTPSPPTTIVPDGTTYSWSVFSQSTWLLTGALPGSNQPSVNGTLTNFSGSLQSVVYSVTPTSGSQGYCVGNAFTLTIYVELTPVPTITSASVPPDPFYNTPCVGETVTYKTESGSGISDWDWLVSSNGTISGSPPYNTPTITVTWTSVGLPNSSWVKVKYKGNGGCQSDYKTLPITVIENPSAALTVPPECGSVCVYAPPCTYSTTPGMSPYNWSLTPTTGWSGFGGTVLDNTYSIQWNTPGTYYVSVSNTNSYGCQSATSTVPVTVNPLPLTPNVIGADSACAGATLIYSTEGSMNEYQWSISPPIPFTTLTPNNQVKIDNIPAGVYSICVSYKNSNGCMPQFPGCKHDIRIYELPIPHVITGNQSVCDSTTWPYSTEPGMSLYSWEFDPTDASHAVSGATSANPTIQWIRGSGDNHHLYVNYTDEHGCRGLPPLIAYPVTVKSLPVPTITSTPNTTDVCLYSTYVYSTQTGPNISGYNWSISPGGYSITGPSNTSSITVTWTTTGPKTVSVTYNENDCPPGSPATMNVYVHALPTPFIAGPDSVCQDKIVTYSTLPGMTSYNWEIQNGTFQSPNLLSSRNVKWTEPPIGVITVNYVDQYGCTALNATDSIIHIMDRPDPTIYGSTYPVCVGEALNYWTVPGAKSYNWSINPPGAGNITGSGYSISITWILPGTHSITVTVQNDFLCDSTSLPFTAIVNARPVIQLTSSGSPVLLSSCTDSIGNIYEAPTGMNKYRWGIQGGIFSPNPTQTSNQVTVSWGNTPPFMIFLNYQNSNDCWALMDAVFEMDVNPRPAAAFSDSLAICDSLVYFTNLSSSSIGTNIYFWNFGDGTNTPAYPHSYKKADGGGMSSYLVKLKAVNANGCPDTVSKRIYMKPCISANFTTDVDSGCARRDVRFTDATMNSALITRWRWKWGDGSPDDVYNSYLPPVIIHAYTDAGTYMVTLEVSNTAGFKESITKSIVINPTPIADFKLSGMCDGQATQFTDLSMTFDPFGDLETSWFWNFTNNPSDTSSLQHPQHTFQKPPNTYNIKLVVNNKFHCKDSLTKFNQRVYSLPVASFKTSTICIEDPTTFVDYSYSTNPGSIIKSWLWNFGDPGSLSDTSTLSAPEYIFPEEGQYAVSLTVTDDNGCMREFDSIVHANISPVSSFTLTDNFNNKPGQVKLNNHSNGASSYSWDFGNGKTSTEQNPVATFTDDGTYTIRLVSQTDQECSDTSLFDYKLLFKGLYVPNAFAPNSSNLKVRLFQPVGTNLKQYHCQVFDMWGHLLWESVKLDEKGVPTEGWDGRFEGNLMPQGNYMWKISATFVDETPWGGSETGVAGSGKTMGSVALIR